MSSQGFGNTLAYIMGHSSPCSVTDITTENPPQRVPGIPVYFILMEDRICQILLLAFIEEEGEDTLQIIHGIQHQLTNHTCHHIDCGLGLLKIEQTLIRIRLLACGGLGAEGFSLLQEGVDLRATAGVMMPLHNVSIVPACVLNPFREQDAKFITGIVLESGIEHRVGAIRQERMLMSIAKAQQSSVVVTDVKGELYRITSGLFKAQGYKIQVINLRDPSHSNGWSILHRASDLTKRGELDRLSELLSDFANVMHPENTKAVDPFWSQTARQLLTGLAGLVCEAPEAFPNMSMWTVQNLCNTLGENSSSRITAMDLAKELPIDSVARNNLSSVLLASDRTLANILVSYAAGMSKLYTSRPLTMMLSTPDIVDFAYIGRERTALYIILPDEKTTLHGIASMIINQTYASLIEYAATSCENERLPVHVDFVLDEFSNLPIIPDMAAKISAGHSRNISFTIIVQGLKQIE